MWGLTVRYDCNLEVETGECLLLVLHGFHSTPDQRRERSSEAKSSVLIDFCIVPISWWILIWSVPQLIIPHYLLVNVRIVQWWVSSIDVGHNHPLVIFCQKIFLFTFPLHWLLLWTSFHNIFFIITGRRKWTGLAHQL